MKRDIPMPALAIQECKPITDTAPHANRFFTHNGLTIKVEATSRETNQSHSLIELTVPGHFPGAPLHYHQKFIESFYILSGQIHVTRGHETLVATPGSLIHMPLGVIHGYHNETAEPARFLVISTPGGFDAYFTDLIAWMKREPQWPFAEPDKLSAFGRHHDTYYI